MSDERIAQLAGDLAEHTGQSVDTCLDALRQALLGPAEPLSVVRRFDEMTDLERQAIGEHVIAEFMVTEAERLRQALQALYDATSDTMAGWHVRTGTPKWDAYVAARQLARDALDDTEQGEPPNA